jgi:hypothetical protein
MASSETEKKQPLLLRVFGPIILLACLLVTILEGADAVSKDIIETHLRELSDSFSKQAALNGKEGTLTYGDISIEGFGFDKYAVIHNVSASVAEKGVMSSSKWTLSTASVTVTQDAFIEGQLFFTFSDPLNIIENSELKSIVTFPRPPKYSYLDGKRGKSRLIEHILSLPEQITISPAKSVDDTSVTKASDTVITYDPNPVINNIYQLDNKEHSIHVEFKNVKIADGEGVRAMANLVSNKFSEKQTDETQMTGRYQLTVSDLFLLISENAMKPYNINADFTTTSTLAAPVLSDKGIATNPPMATSADITINSFDIITSDFGIRVDGAVTDSLDDQLIFGQTNVHFNNIANFLSSELVPQHAKGALSMAVERVMAQPFDRLVDITITLKREKKGVLYVNDLTFEDVATSLFTDLMKASEQPEGMSIAPPSSGVSQLPARSPVHTAPAGAAPYAPVLSKPVETLPPLTPEQKLLQQSNTRGDKK